MAKFGKFLLSTAAVIGTAATAYYIYKNVKIKVDVDEDEDLDDFSEEEETEETTYVTLNPDSPVKEAWSINKSFVWINLTSPGIISPDDNFTISPGTIFSISIVSFIFFKYFLFI